MEPIAIALLNLFKARKEILSSDSNLSDLSYLTLATHFCVQHCQF